jgi:hypothetical protein
MVLDNSNRHKRRVAKIIQDSKQGSVNPAVGLWNWVNGVANGVEHFLSHTVLNGFKIIMQHLQNLDTGLLDVLNSVRRIVFWVDILIWHIVRSWIARATRKAEADNNKLGHYLIGVIYISTQTVLTTCMRAINAERKQRVRQVHYAEARAKAEVKALHGVIEREAASAYRVSNDQRKSLIVRLLDFAATRNPELRLIVKDIATGLLDLLEIEDPPLRLLLGFLVKQVIDRLGIDKAAGALIKDLIYPIIGKGPPKSLHDTILDITQRLDAVEAQWAKFMEDGGSQVEQAGTDWRNITSIAASIAIVAFTAQAMVDPSRWASEIADTVGTAANDLSLRAEKLFKG